MEKLRIMSFDLDSFVLVKGIEEKSKRVIDYLRKTDADLGILQGDNNLLYDLSTMLNEYNIIYDYCNSMFLVKPILDIVDNFSSVDCSAFVTKLIDEKIAFCSIKKRKKESLSELRDILKEYESVGHKVLAGTLPNVNIDSFCDKYDFVDICNGPRSNHILVSKGIDAKVVERPIMDSVEVQPMVVDITYKKVRSDYEKFKNT